MIHIWSKCLIFVFKTVKINRETSTNTVRRPKGKALMFYDDSRAQKEEDRLPLSPSENSANERLSQVSKWKATIPQTQFLQWMFVYYRPQNSLFPSIKRVLLSIFVGELHLGHHSCRPQISILWCWSQVNSFLLQKYLAVCLFKVNKTVFEQHEVVKFIQEFKFFYLEKGLNRK